MTSDYSDDYIQPRPRLSRRIRLSSIEELDADRVPEGTVAARVLRLQQLASQDPTTPPLPLSTRDRDGESSGWGRRVEGEVRPVQPASRVKSIEANHGIARRAVSSYLRRPSTLSAIPESSTPPSAHHGLASIERRLPSRMRSDSTADEASSTASSRREDARQILEEHRLSLPPG